MDIFNTERHTSSTTEGLCRVTSNPLGNSTRALTMVGTGQEGREGVRVSRRAGREGEGGQEGHEEDIELVRNGWC